MLKLFDSELKVMEVLWEHGPMTAGDIAALLKQSIGWSRNTTYTVIKKCIAKGAVRREEPKFLCVPLISRSDAQSFETKELIGRMFGGSRLQFLSQYLGQEDLTDSEIAELREILKRETD